MGRIDVSTDDKGLGACFDAANITAEWKGLYMSYHKVITLDDFVYMIDSTAWEKSLESHLQQVGGLRDNRIVLARFKSAYEAGLSALRAAAAPNQKVEDPDEPLPESTMTQMNQDWTHRYNLQFDASIEPSESLRSRIYREFKRGTMTVIEAKKIRSVLHMASPKVNESVDLAGGLQLNFQSESLVAVKSVTSYYYALRTLAHAWAWAGNFLVKAADGSSSLMMDLTTALAYCDKAMQDTFAFGQGSLAWLERNDLLTRGKMATYIRRGYTAAGALHEAIRETHLEWRSPATMMPVVDPQSARTKRPAEESEFPAVPEAQPRKRAIKADNFRTVSQIKGGARLCKPYNDGRGCTDRHCTAVHSCDVKMPNGQACLSKKHTRLSHPADNKE